MFLFTSLHFTSLHFTSLHLKFTSQILSAGCTAYEHKAAALMHMLQLEVGIADLPDYCNQVVATISDQGLPSSFELRF